MLLRHLSVRTEIIAPFPAVHSLAGMLHMNPLPGRNLPFGPVPLASDSERSGRPPHQCECTSPSATARGKRICARPTRSWDGLGILCAARPTQPFIDRSRIDRADNVLQVRLRNIRTSASRPESQGTNDGRAAARNPRHRRSPNARRRLRSPRGRCSRRNRDKREAALTAVEQRLAAWTLSGPSFELPPAHRRERR